MHKWLRLIFSWCKSAVLVKQFTVFVSVIVNSDNVLVRIFKIGTKRVSGVFTGILHISDVRERYVKSMNDVCKPGDIIRTKVISKKNQVSHLSTNDKSLGVVYAFCSRCSNLLEQKRHDMACPNCGNVEKRKPALDYGKEEL